MDVNEPVATKKLFISAIIKETDNIKSFRLIHPDADITYQAGQFLTFIFSDQQQNEIRRSYSMSSSPALEEPLTITVKRIDNGEISRRLHDNTKPGDILYTIGASGFFTLPEAVNAYTQLIFFAAGTGIVPIYSLIKTVLKTDHQIKILLVYSNHSMRSTVFYKELKRLQQEFSLQFRIEFLFSNSFYVRTARLTPESLEEILMEYRVSYLPTILFYVCGPSGYMRMISIKLLTLGVKPSNIKKEIFKIDKPAQVLLPPDTRPHAVSVYRGRQKYQFMVQYPLTILAAAKKLNIPLPFSCESGQCGTCAATCIKGKVWMSDNQVLLDEELEKGKILTCTGFPVQDDVELMMSF
jgi:ferredoxin-NADP reductase